MLPETFRRRAANVTAAEPTTHSHRRDHAPGAAGATDPVCGMKISKSWAVAQMEYRGETYYFCIEECREKFALDPQRYVMSAARAK